MGKHDSSYKLFFSHGKIVADLLSGFIHEDWAGTRSRSRRLVAPSN